MSRADELPLPDAPWGIISIKAQAEEIELPMQPITAMRNFNTQISKYNICRLLRAGIEAGR